MKKIRIKSDGTVANTHAVAVLEDGTEEELPPHNHIEWVADASSTICTATITYLDVEVEVDAQVEEEEPDPVKQACRALLLDRKRHEAVMHYAREKGVDVGAADDAIRELLAEEEWTP